MLRKASELAVKAGDPALMFQTVDRLAAQFQLDALAVKQTLFVKLADRARGGDRLDSLVQGARTLIDAALAADREDRFDLALAVSQASQAMAFRKAMAERRKEILALQKEAEQAAQILEAVVANPQDPDANLQAGRYYCFANGDWAQGLPYLAKGSDDALKSLAAEELAPAPAKADDKVARGDAWWDAAEKAAIKDKPGMRRRAGYWYQGALGDLPPGLTKTKLEKRLAQVTADKSPQPHGSGKVPPPLSVAPFDAKAAILHQKRWANYLRLSVEVTNAIGMKLVLIPPGEFMMGSPPEAIQEELNTPNTPKCDAERCRTRVPGIACGSRSRFTWARTM